MAAVHVKEVTNRDASLVASSEKRFTRTFQVLTESPPEGAKSVRDAAGVPVIGDPWQGIDEFGAVEIEPNVVCVEKRVAQTDPENFQNWTVVCLYVGVDDPLAQPPQVNWTTEKYQETTQQDATGRLVANSAGDPYESGITRDRSRFVLVIQQNVSDFNPIEAHEYIDTVNDALIFVDDFPPGLGAGTCKMDDLSGEAVYYPDFPVRTAVHYWIRRVRITFDNRANPHQALVMDAGFRELNADGTALKTILIDHAKPSTPMPLDGTGRRLPVGFNPLSTVEGGDVVYHEFVKYLGKDWAPLDLRIS